MDDAMYVVFMAEKRTQYSHILLLNEIGVKTWLA